MRMWKKKRRKRRKKVRSNASTSQNTDKIFLFYSFHDKIHKRLGEDVDAEEEEQFSSADESSVDGDDIDFWYVW